MFKMKKAAISIMTMMFMGIPVCLNGMTNTVSADVSLCDISTNSAVSNLSIKNAEATCSSGISGTSGVTTKILLTQTLQKKNTSGKWGIVKAWSSSTTEYRASVTSTLKNLAKGTYRLKTVFTVYSGNKSETITKYSSSVTVK